MRQRRLLALGASVFSLGVSFAGCVPDDSGVIDTRPKPTPDPITPAPRDPSAGPPPISGGTLLVGRDGVTAVAADPDRDTVWIADVGTRTLRASVALQPGDEPGRVAQDAAGRYHVALRGGGAVVSFEADGSDVERRAVCAAPRGLTFDAAQEKLWVACAGGELVRLPARGTDGVRTVRLDRDLRDVVVSNGRTFVSRFKSAELLEVDASGAVLSRVRPPALPVQEKAPNGIFNAQHEAAVAWRTVPLPGGRVGMMHHRGTDSVLSTKMPGGYSGGGCGGIVSATLSLITPGEAPRAFGELLQTVLPVDVAVSPGGDRVTVVSAAASEAMGKLPSVSTYSLTQIDTLVTCSPAMSASFVSGAVAVAYDGTGRLVVQSREPAALYIDGQILSLAGAASKADVGHGLFHGVTRAGLACASCHPEGGEDGRVWNFETSGPRRTQSLRGGILGTEPFHWDGDMGDFGVLMTEVMMRRMGGPLTTGVVSTEQTAALSRWLDRLPSLPGVVGPDAAAPSRGQAIFADASVGCATCHSGPKGTDNQAYDVGTGGAFQVPMLRGLPARAPFLHNGCAATLRDRFGACGGGEAHGHTSALSPAQLDDLIAYLETL